MQELMTIKEAANYLRISSSTIYKLVEKGRIPASKVGGAWRFKKDVLDDWLNMQCCQPRGLVLVVDDDARVRGILGDIIVEQGYQVVSVESGQRAIEEVGRQSFNLVFLDLVLPDLSGIDVLRKLKAKDRNITVAVVTGYGDDPIAMEAVSMSPLVLIGKPFSVEDIHMVLSFVAGRQQAKQRSSDNDGLRVVIT